MQFACVFRMSLGLNETLSRVLCFVGVCTYALVYEVHRSSSVPALHLPDCACVNEVLPRSYLILLGSFTKLDNLYSVYYARDRSAE
jgi:hypothetical protein